MKIQLNEKDELLRDFIHRNPNCVRQGLENYLAFTFQDDTGTIEGKLWDAQLSQCRRIYWLEKSCTCKGAEKCISTPSSQSNYLAIA